MGETKVECKAGEGSLDRWVYVIYTHMYRGWECRQGSVVHLVQSGIPELSSLTVHMGLCSIVIHRELSRGIQRRYTEEIYRQQSVKPTQLHYKYLPLQYHFTRMIYRVMQRYTEPDNHYTMSGTVHYLHSNSKECPCNSLN